MSRQSPDITDIYYVLCKKNIDAYSCELRFFKHELVYLQLELDVVFGLVLPGWRKDCVGLA